MAVLHILRSSEDDEALAWVRAAGPATVVVLAGEAPQDLPAGLEALVLADPGQGPGRIGTPELARRIFEAERVFCW